MAEIVTFLAAFVEEAASNQAIKDAAKVVDAGYMTPELEDRGRRALTVLVDAAIADGDLRPSVTADDIYLLMIGAPSSLAKPLRDRWLEILLAGLRVP